MGWFKYDAIPKATIIVAFLVTLTHTSRIPKQGQSEIYLANLCVVRSDPQEKPAPVIMLHGLTDRKETWDGIYQNIPMLTRRKVCIYDARNHGDSDWIDTFTVDALTEDLENFMRDMKMEKAALVGHSLGGLTAMNFALKNPDKVESLFIEDITPVNINRTKGRTVEMAKYWKLLLDSLTVIPENADEATAKKVVADYIKKGESEVVPPERMFEVYGFHLRDGVWQWKNNFAAFIKALRSANLFLPKFEGQYDQKTFFIYGTESRHKVGDQKAGIKKLFPNAEFFGVEGAGHVIHIKYREFLTKLIQFLK